MSRGRDPTPDDRVGGYILVTCGALIMLLSGACSSAMLFSSSGGGLEYLPMVAIFGGVPFLAGGVCLAMGLWMLRPGKRPDTDLF